MLNNKVSWILSQLGNVRVHPNDGENKAFCVVLLQRNKEVPRRFSIEVVHHQPEAACTRPPLDICFHTHIPSS